MPMIALTRCLRETATERKLNKEYLNALITSDEQGEYISHNVRTIINNRNIVVKNGVDSGSVSTTRAKENIKTCINIIKSRVERLGATPAETENIINLLNEEDYESVTLRVLELMARKNPGMHKRKYEQALRMVASERNQKQY